MNLALGTTPPYYLSTYEIPRQYLASLWSYAPDNSFYQRANYSAIGEGGTLLSALLLSSIYL